jgi:hypothetical protein
MLVAKRTHIYWWPARFSIRAKNKDNFQFSIQSENHEKILNVKVSIKIFVKFLKKKYSLAMFTFTAVPYRSREESKTRALSRNDFGKAQPNVIFLLLQNSFLLFTFYIYLPFSHYNCVKILGVIKLPRQRRLV